MSNNSTKPQFFKQLGVSFLSVLLSLTLVCTSISSDAYADVRKADIVLGQTIDSRGLSVAQCPNIESEYVVVMDASGTVYFERNSTSPAQIASITKIMTALVALDVASSNSVEPLITVSDRAASVGESSANLQSGDVLSFNDALKGLMLSSGNDAAIAIAESFGEIISGGTAHGSDAEQVFVTRMNEKAIELGLVDTVFTNPHGLDDGAYASDQHSCARDVAIMAQVAMANDAFREVVSMSEATIYVTRSNGEQASLALETTNVLLGSYEGTCGIKTGITNAAGYCFAGAINRNGQDMYVVVLKAPDENVRFEDTKILYDWVSGHIIEYQLAHSEKNTTMSVDGESKTVQVIAEVAHSEWIDKTVKVTLADPDQTVTIFDLNGNVNQTVEYNTITGDVHVGEKVGTITFKQRNDELVTVDLVACEEVKAPDLFEGIGIWWDRLFRGFSGQPTEAETILYNQTPLISQKASTE